MILKELIVKVTLDLKWSWTAVLKMMLLGVKPEGDEIMKNIITNAKSNRENKE